MNLKSTFTITFCLLATFLAAHPGHNPAEHLIPSGEGLFLALVFFGTLIIALRRLHLSLYFKRS